MRKNQTKTRWRSIWLVTLGMLALFALFAFLGIWGTQARLSGAVIASGTVEVETNRLAVQHEEGGRVQEIFVRDGDRVERGQVLAVLDTVSLTAELTVLETQYADLVAKQIRLQAELSGSTTLSNVTHFTVEAWAQTAFLDAFSRQSNLFTARVQTHSTKISLLNEEMHMLDHQVVGLDTELSALQEQHKLVEEELLDTTQLLSKNLVELRRWRQTARDKARLEALIGQTTARIAESRGMIATLNVEREELAAEKKENATLELSEIAPRLIEIFERRRVLKSRLERRQLRSPAAGIVFESTVFAQSSVLRPGTNLLSIVPENEPFLINARIMPTDIDKVQLGQSAKLMFAALDQSRAPEVSGTVVRISADVLEEPNTGMRYFTAHLRLNENSLAAFKEVDLVPGMPAEVFITTSNRSPLNYLLKPFTDYFSKALRET